MRSFREKLFDDFFYGFDSWWYPLFNDKALRRLVGYKDFGPEFNAAYKNEIRPYWAQFGVRTKKYWFKYLYQLSGSTDPRYIPHSLFMKRIVPYFDNPIYIRQLADKNLHTLMFPTVKRPETVFKRIKNSYLEDDFLPITKEEAYARLKREGSYIIKPTRDSSQGTDVRFFTAFSSDDEIDALLRNYDGKTDYIIQRAVVQHPGLARFNASSLNTLRIVTLVFRDKPYILSSILRIGGSGSRVDNVSKGGYQCTVKPDGSLEPLAYTCRSGKDEMVEENENGLRWADCAVPSFDRVRETALDLAARMPHLKLIGWDLAVDDEGDVVLIEFNSQIGQNQATCGPTFGDLTDDVLTEVFGRKK